MARIAGSPPVESRACSQPGLLVAFQRLPEHFQCLDHAFYLRGEGLKLDVDSTIGSFSARLVDGIAARSATTDNRRRSQSDRKLARMINSSRTTRVWV